MHSINKNKKSTTSLVLVSLTIGHPCNKEKANENLVYLISPNIGGESIINAVSPIFHSQKKLYTIYLD